MERFESLNWPFDQSSCHRPSNYLSHTQETTSCFGTDPPPSYGPDSPSLQPHCGNSGQQQQGFWFSSKGQLESRSRWVSGTQSGIRNLVKDVRNSETITLFPLPFGRRGDFPFSFHILLSPLLALKVLSSCAIIMKGFSPSSSLKGLVHVPSSENITIRFSRLAHVPGATECHHQIGPWWRPCLWNSWLL